MDIITILTTTESGIAQGLMWALLTLGVYITFRLLDVADLTIEGTFPLGAAVTVVLINGGWNPFLAVAVAMLAGALAGLVTGIFNSFCKIPAILSGILTMIALYSINIRIMSGKATVAIMGDTVKSKVSSLLRNLFGQELVLKSNTLSIVVGVLTVVAVIILLYIFFGTEIGCAIRATGSNQHMARALGVSTNRMTILGLMISNALIALSGSLIAQFDYGSALVNMGQGTIVIGLASVIIGEVLFLHKEHFFWFKMTAIVLGAIVYRTIIAFAMRVPWLDATDLKLITAVVVAFALALPVIKAAIAANRAKRANNRFFSAGGAENA